MTIRITNMFAGPTPPLNSGLYAVWFDTSSSPARIRLRMGGDWMETAGVDLDQDSKPDTAVNIASGSRASSATITEDTDSYNIDINQDGVADIVIPKGSS